MQKKNIHFLTQAAMIAALYVVLTFIANAFGSFNNTCLSSPNKYIEGRERKKYSSFSVNTFLTS